MAKMRDFNPKAVLVIRKASGLSLGGRRYLQGEAIEDDCISMRKRQQLYAQNYLCYPYDLPENAFEDAKAREPDIRTEDEKAADEKAEADRVAAETEAQEAADKEAAEKAAEAEEKAKADAAAEAAQSEDVKPEAGNGDDPDASVATGSETQEGEGESSEAEPTKPVVKKRRARKSKKS